MKRKAIEKIPWQSQGEKKRMMVSANVYTIGGEEVLIVDFALDKPVSRIALSHNDFENFVPPDSPCVNLPKWNRRLYDNFRSQRFALPYDVYLKWEIIVDRKTIDTIHCFVYGADDRYNTDWNSDINYLQHEILYDKREKAEQRRLDRIKKKMNMVPEPTKDFKKWAISVVEKHIMYMLPFRKKQTTKTVCSACQSHNEYEKEKIKPGQLIICPSCGVKCMVKRVDYENQILIPGYKFSKEVLLFQKIGIEFCERHFKLLYEVEFHGENLKITETGRVFYPVGSFSAEWRGDPENIQGKKRATYFNKYSPWTTNETLWDDKNFAGQSVIVLGNGLVYPKTVNKKIFHGTRYQYCAMEVIKNQMNITPIEYLRKYDRTPQAIEMLVKMGMYRMAMEITSYDFNGNGRPWERLGISKKHLNRMRHINGGHIALEWMRYEEGTGKKLEDKTIKFFETEFIRPNDINFIMDRMSGQQIMNYIVKQCKQGKVKIVELLRLWKDYLSMASRMKMDLQKEMVYKPKNIKVAHDNMIILCDNSKVIMRAGEIAQKFPDVDNILQSIKDKYEYCDNKYTIIVPKRIEDIIYEGRTLGHCLDKSDIYFDRIQRRESFIVFLRKIDDIERPYYTMEIEPDGTTRQKRTTGDRQDKDFRETVSFIQKWQREVRKRLDENDKNLAAQSAELREQEFKELRMNQTKVWHGMLAGKLLVDVLEADLMIANEY